MICHLWWDWGFLAKDAEVHYLSAFNSTQLNSTLTAQKLRKDSLIQFWYHRISLNYFRTNMIYSQKCISSRRAEYTRLIVLHDRIRIVSVSLRIICTEILDDPLRLAGFFLQVLPESASRNVIIWPQLKNQQFHDIFLTARIGFICFEAVFEHPATLVSLQAFLYRTTFQTYPLPSPQSHLALALSLQSERFDQIVPRLTH